jgi:hypothetical protein
MLLNGEAQIEETAMQFPQFAMLHSVNMCSTKADINSRKLRLRCGCQFIWCALAQAHPQRMPVIEIEIQIVRSGPDEIVMGTYKP